MTRPLINNGATVVDADSAFGELIGGSHRMASRADVLFNREPIVEGLAVTGGSVTLDRTAAILGTCAVTVADPDRVPVSSADVLTPYGYELRLWRGVSVGGGEILAPLGVFPIQRSSVDGVTLVSRIEGKDRSKLVSDAIFENTYQVAAGTNYATAIQELIEDAVDGLEFLFPSTSYTTPTLTFGPDVNRWSAARQMAQDIGNEILFDGLGRCVMRTEPTFQDSAAGVVAEGANMLAVTVDQDREPAYNKVIARSSNASNPTVYWGSAQDDEVASPTYYDGPFGKKARQYASPFLASNSQCESAAAAILASNLGVAKSVNVSALPDPRREPSDVIRVTREALGIDELYIVDSLTIGMSATDIMTMKVRAQQAETV